MRNHIFFEQVLYRQKSMHEQLSQMQSVVRVRPLYSSNLLVVFWLVLKEVYHGLH